MMLFPRPATSAINAPSNLELSESVEMLRLLENDKIIIDVYLDFNKIDTRFIKIVIPNYGIIPEGKQGAGNKAWTFIDEIIIE